MTDALTTENFGVLVEQYERLVYTVCYQFTHDAQLAQDLAQETFLSAYTHRADCPLNACKPWLARIATNKAKDYLKSAYHRRVTAVDGSEEMPLGTAPSEAQPENITIEKSEVERIRAQILALKEPYAQVARLYFLQDMSVDAIAAQLNRPFKTVHTQLYRAKHMLQKTLERGTHHGIV